MGDTQGQRLLENEALGFRGRAANHSKFSARDAVGKGQTRSEGGARSQAVTGAEEPRAWGEALGSPSTRTVVSKLKLL